MAIRFTAANAGLIRTTNIVAASSAYTAIVWFRPNSDLTPGQYRAVLARRDAGYTVYAGIFSLDDASQDYRVDAESGGLASTTARTLTAGTWYPLVIQYNAASTHSFKFGDDVIGTASKDINALTFADLILGADGASEPDCDFAYFREWNAFLSSAQLRAEFHSAAAVRTSNLIADTPLVSDILDDSGNGNDWTAVGVNSFVAGPTFPANCVSSGATVISSLPYSIVQSSKVTGQEFIFDQWYKYTGTSAFPSLGVFGFGHLTDYEADLEVFSPDAVTSYNIFGLNVPVQFAVSNGVDYFLKFAGGGLFATANLTLSVIAGPNSTAPIEAILVNDDQDGYPLIVLSSTVDYEVLKLVSPFVSGEQGDGLPTQTRYLFSNDNDDSFNLYESDLTFLQTIASFGTGSPIIRTCLGANKFYGGHASTGEVRSIARDGTLGAIHNTGNVIGGIAASNDETILYNARGTANQAIRRWDLVNDIALSDLAAGIANYAPLDILVPEDDSIIVGYTRAGIEHSIRRYNAAGTLLNTYTFSATNELGVRLAYSKDDPTAFWAWFRNTTTNLMTFKKIRISDGTILVTRIHARFEAGASEETPTATPTALFGASFCCPFVIVSSSVVPGGLFVVVTDRRSDTNGTEDTAIIAFFKTGYIGE